MRRFVLLAAADLVLLLAAFGLVHLANYGHLNISGTAQDLLKIQILVWLGVSLFARKFTRIPNLSFIMGSGLVLKAGIGISFVLSLVIVGLHYTHFSRTMAYASIVVFVLLEIGTLALYQWIRGPVPHPGKLPLKSTSALVSRPLFLLDGALLVLSFFAVTYLKRGSFYLTDPYDDILLILLGLWLVFSLLTRKLNRDNFNDIATALGLAIRTALFMAAGLTFLIYLFRIDPVSRLQALGPIPLFLILEGFVFILYSNFRRHGRLEKDIEDASQVSSMLGREEDIPIQDQFEKVEDPVKTKLEHALVFFDPALFLFIRKHIDLDKVEYCRCSLMSTDNMFNLDVMEKEGMNLIINLHKINDVRWFNRYFLLSHEKLRPGGYLVGKAHTTATQRDYYLNKYPGVTGQILYVLKFIWGRVCPKLPWVQKIYFSITKGRNRSVSRAEVLGRLFFCGFEIVAEKEMDRRVFFIARKVKKPRFDKNPTYGPLVRLKRTGLGGKPITVYKFRTMYPFSEYLQEYVYEHNSLKEGGKFKDDFRVTGWGKIFRRLWIDELPMIYNWLRGDLALVGVRPLSRQYLELYSTELKELRRKVRPGLLPPFYADMPGTLEEIMDSERKYIEAYLKRPFRTQVRYFFRCVYNIVIRKARSG